MADIPVRVVYETQDALQDSDMLVDGAGNRFVAIQLSNQSGGLILKLTRSLVLSLVGYVRPPSGRGVSGVALADDGADLAISVTGHAWAEGAARVHYLGQATIPGVLVPRSGGSGDPGPTPPPPPVGDDVDYNRVADTVIAKFAAELATADSRLNKAFINSDRVAIQREQVLTEGNVNSSAGLYARIRDTVWEQLAKFFGPR